MPLYRYQALSKEGRKVAGVVKADSFEVAKELLSKQKILVTNIFSLKDKTKQIKLSQSALLSFTRDLSQLLQAGLPLYESLVTIEEKYQTSKSHPLFLELCDLVKSGKHLSEALSFFPKIFDQVYVCMVASAEETGSLPEVFVQLEKLITREQKLKKQLSSAMIYPMFLLGFCLIVVNALFFFLIPSMQQLFEERTLHPFTKTILGISNFLRNNVVTLGCGLVFSITSLGIFFSRTSGKLFLQKMFLRVSFLRRMITQAVLTRFCRGLSVMLSGSVSMLDALKLSKGIMKNPYFEEVITKVQQRVEQGGKFSEELEKSPLIPPLVTRMLKIAEETGNVPKMLENVSEIYEEDLERSLTRLTFLLQPIMLLFLAFIVGVVILSILLPLTDVGSFLN